MAYRETEVEKEIMKEIEFAKQENPQIALGMERILNILNKHDVFLILSDLEK